jgi:hypothetical protein
MSKELCTPFVFFPFFDFAFFDFFVIFFVFFAPSFVFFVCTGTLLHAGANEEDEGGGR